ncbi:MAG TPA: hypothetical protein VF538_08635 [Pyrinomonadaceae bacterium]|jgi:hypothetical protein
MTNEWAGREDDGAVERGRADERGDAAETDAPVSAEQNEGMSTILSADPLDGVQDNDGES